MSLSAFLPSRAISRIGVGAISLLCLLAFTGCWVYSIEPLYEANLSHADPDLIFDQSLVGSWGQLEGNCLWILTITGDQQAYDLKMAPAPECKSQEKATEYAGHLVKLGNGRFLDVLPKSDEVCDLCLPLHTFLLVSQENDNLHLIPLDRDWLVQAMDEKKVTLTELERHGPFDQVTLTASSVDLKKLIRQYADDKDAFKADSETKLTFKRR